MVLGVSGGHVPKVDAELALRTFNATHQAICERAIVACHDLSEGGLAVAVAEMSFAGEHGVELDISSMRRESFVDPSVALFSESNSRFLVEVPVERVAAFEACMQTVPWFRIGSVTLEPNVRIACDRTTLIDVPWIDLRDAWRSQLDFK
jgi:phosphoribosylformylglycinamidine synthase